MAVMMKTTRIITIITISPATTTITKLQHEHEIKLTDFVFFFMIFGSADVDVAPKFILFCMIMTFAYCLTAY